MKKLDAEKNATEEENVENGNTAAGDSGANEKDKGEIAQLRKISSDYRDTLQQMQAEFENAAKRAQKEKEEFRSLAGAKLLEEFLPLVDSMNEAIKHAEKNGNAEMKAGTWKILSQMMKILERNGVRQIRAMGHKFDAGTHECLMTGNEEGKEDGAVLEEFQKGYTLDGRVLRPAKVKVNQKQG